MHTVNKDLKNTLKPFLFRKKLVQQRMSFCNFYDKLWYLSLNSMTVDTIKLADGYNIADWLNHMVESPSIGVLP